MANPTPSSSEAAVLLVRLMTQGTPCPTPVMAEEALKDLEVGRRRGRVSPVAAREIIQVIREAEETNKMAGFLIVKPRWTALREELEREVGTE